MSLQRLNPKDEKLPINSVNLRVKYPPVCDLVTFPSAAEVTPPTGTGNYQTVNFEAVFVSSHRRPWRIFPVFFFLF